MSFTKMKSWFRSVRSGSSLDEAKRDARLGLEEVESEEEFYRRLYEHEKKKALKYRQQDNHQHAHILAHMQRNHQSFKAVDNSMSMGSNYTDDDISFTSESSLSDNDVTGEGFDGRRGLSYRFNVDGPLSSRTGSGSSSYRSGGNSPSGSDFNMSDWGNQQTSQLEDEVHNQGGSSDNNNNIRNGNNSIEEGSTINVGDRVQALYTSENVWYPATVIDINISDDTGGIEFDIQYDGFDGADAFEYNKPAAQITLNESDGLGAISEEEEFD